MSEFQHIYEGGESQCVHCRGWTRGANLRTECPARLRAEVERLRAEALEREERTARIMLEAERHRRIADEAVERIESSETERAAVLSWLHRMERNARHWGGKDDERADIYARLADVFECGEHLDEYFGKKEQ